MKIDGREICKDTRPYTVIEIGSGWGSADPEESVTFLMTKAKEAGACAVKIQVYQPQDLTIDGLPALETGPWKGQTLWEIYERGTLPEVLLPSLFARARHLGITLFASVFSERVIPLLESCGCPAYKVASAELNHDELLRAIARTGKPAILSTGMSTLNEVHHARFAFTHDEVALLHCVAEYPATPPDADLGRITALQRLFDPERVGLSDHTRGCIAATVAVGLGATIIEKHVALPGSLDASFAMRPYELQDFCKMVSDAWETTLTHVLLPADRPDGHKYRRSIRALGDINPGDELTRGNVAVLRPAGGADPQELPLMLGARALTAVKRGGGVLVAGTTVGQEPLLG